MSATPSRPRPSVSNAAYGQGTVYFSPGSNDEGCYAPTSSSRRHLSALR
ncbi:MAG: hypothetical protein WD042_16725 [Phycisphaeraceae bacterium]